MCKEIKTVSNSKLQSLCFIQAKYHCIENSEIIAYLFEFPSCIFSFKIDAVLFPLGFSETFPYFVLPRSDQWLITEI